MNIHSLNPFEKWQMSKISCHKLIESKWKYCKLLRCDWKICRRKIFEKYHFRPIRVWSLEMVFFFPTLWPNYEKRLFHECTFSLHNNFHAFYVWQLFQFQCIEFETFRKMLDDIRISIRKTIKTKDSKIKMMLKCKHLDKLLLSNRKMCFYSRGA